MSKKEKLIKKLLSLPKDFRYDELETLMNLLDFTTSNKGRTSGSRVLFHRKSDNVKIAVHKPHPSPVMKVSALKYVVQSLKDSNVI